MKKIYVVDKDYCGKVLAFASYDDALAVAEKINGEGFGENHIEELFLILSDEPKTSRSNG